MATPTEAAEARAQEEARAHSRPADGFAGRSATVDELVTLWNAIDGVILADGGSPGVSVERQVAVVEVERAVEAIVRRVQNGASPPSVKPVRLTRAEVERVLAAVPEDSAVILREIITRSTKAPLDDEETAATCDLLGALAEGIA